MQGGPARPEDGGPRLDRDLAKRRPRVSVGCGTPSSVGKGVLEDLVGTRRREARGLTRAVGRSALHLRLFHPTGGCEGSLRPVSFRNGVRRATFSGKKRKKGATRT